MTLLYQTTKVTTQSNIHSQHDVCRVVNRHKEQFDVYVGRGTKWGNPYKDLPRKDAIALYRVLFIRWVRDGIITREELMELKGKRLGCSCHPKPCHADIIAQAVNKLCKIRTNNLDLFYECG